MNENAWMSAWGARSADFQLRCRDEQRHFLSALGAPHDAQRAVVRDLVDSSAKARFWKQTSLGSAESFSAFRNAVPMRRYVDYEPYIQLECDAKGGVLSESPVLRWLKTSGTTGVAKRIPYTRHWMGKYRVPAMFAMWAAYLDVVPSMLDSPYGVLDTQTIREDVTDLINAVPYQAISNRHPPLGDDDWVPPWYGAPWFRNTMPLDFEAKMYHRLRFLIGKDVRFLSGINPSTLISLHDCASRFADRLIRDIADGTLEGRSLGDPAPEMALCLEQVLGRTNFSMRDIWPSLAGISCWMSASSALYLEQLDRAYPDIRRVPFMTCGTEGVVTIPIDADAESQPLAVTQGFYEFVPADVDLDDILTRGNAQPETLLFDELTTGADYHLIMSQGNGLHRLVTGDIFRVMGMQGSVPRLQFVRRDGVFHSFTGEKLTEGQVTEAIVAAARGLGIRTGLHMCGPKWGNLPHYVLALEVMTPGDVDNHSLADAVDRALQDINIEYGLKRNRKHIGPMQVAAVPRGTINAYIDRRRCAGNSNQIKYKPFHQNIDFVSELQLTLK